MRVRNRHPASKASLMKSDDALARLVFALLVAYVVGVWLFVLWLIWRMIFAL